MAAQRRPRVPERDKSSSRDGAAHVFRAVDGSSRCCASRWGPAKPLAVVGRGPSRRGGTLSAGRWGGHPQYGRRPRRAGDANQDRTFRPRALLATRAGLGPRRRGASPRSSASAPWSDSGEPWSVAQGHREEEAQRASASAEPGSRARGHGCLSARASPEVPARTAASREAARRGCARTLRMAREGPAPASRSPTARQEPGVSQRAPLRIEPATLRPEAPAISACYLPMGELAPAPPPTAGGAPRPPGTGAAGGRGRCDGGPRRRPHPRGARRRSASAGGPNGGEAVFCGAPRASRPAERSNPRTAAAAWCRPSSGRAAGPQPQDSSGGHDRGARCRASPRPGQARQTTSRPVPAHSPAPAAVISWRPRGARRSASPAHATRRARHALEWAHGEAGGFRRRDDRPLEATYSCATRPPARPRWGGRSSRRSRPAPRWSVRRRGQLHSVDRPLDRDIIDRGACESSAQRDLPPGRGLGHRRGGPPHPRRHAAAADAQGPGGRLLRHRDRRRGGGAGPDRAPRRGAHPAALRPGPAAPGAGAEPHAPRRGRHES